MSKSFFRLLARVSGILVCVMHAAAHAQVEPLRLDGSRFVDVDGEPVTLTGVNIGNWLLLEPWMLAVPTEGREGFRDQHDIITLLERRFGEERAEALLDSYRSNWFTERDAQIIRSFGMNVVRVPFHYSLLTSATGPLTLRDDAFEWLDRAVGLASGAGLYVILDLHGAPGGQSIDMPTGHVEQNQLWASEANQERTVWLWQQIADRYKNNDAVIAYDLLNEPYGDFQTDLSSELISLMDDIIAAVRSVDPETLVFLPGQFSGIEFYGDPRELGWTNAGFTEHLYPGIFGGDERSLRRHARFVACEFEVRRHQMNQLDVPFLVGEFNTIFESIGGAALLAEHVGRFEDEGWITTNWAYRLHRNDGTLPADNWTMVVNAEAFAFDLHGMTYEELLDATERLGRTALEMDLKLADALRTDRHERAEIVPVLPAAEMGEGSAHVPGWEIRGVGGAAIGACIASEKRIGIAGGGEDVFGKADSFVLATPVAESVSADRSFAADVLEFTAQQRFAKAGVMVRRGADPDAPGAPHASVHVVPSGEVVMLWRETPNGQSFEKVLGLAALPVRLGVIDHGDHVEAWVSDRDGVLSREVFPRGVAIGDASTSGLFVLSHENPAVARAVFSHVASGEEASIVSSTHSPVDSEPEPNIPHDAGWMSWGNLVSQSAGALSIGVADGANDVGAWRDVRVGRDGWQTLAFEARRVGQPGEVSLEVRTEAVDAELYALASESFDVSHLPDGDRWTRLELETPIMSSSTRVLFRVLGDGETPVRVNIRNITLISPESAE